MTTTTNELMQANSLSLKLLEEGERVSISANKKHKRILRRSVFEPTLIVAETSSLIMFYPLTIEGIRDALVWLRLPNEQRYSVYLEWQATL